MPCRPDVSPEDVSRLGSALEDQEDLQNTARGDQQHHVAGTTRLPAARDRYLQERRVEVSVKLRVAWPRTREAKFFKNPTPICLVSSIPSNASGIGDIVAMKYSCIPLPHTTTLATITAASASIMQTIAERNKGMSVSRPTMSGRSMSAICWGVEPHQPDQRAERSVKNAAIRSQAWPTR